MDEDKLMAMNARDSLAHSLARSFRS